MCQQICFGVWTYAFGINFCKGYWQPAHLVLVISDSVSLHWVFYFPWIRWSIHFPYLYHIDFFNRSQIHVICSCSSSVTLFNVLFPSVTTPNIFIRKTLGKRKTMQGLSIFLLFFCASREFWWMLRSFSRLYTVLFEFLWVQIFCLWCTFQTLGRIIFFLVCRLITLATASYTGKFVCKCNQLCKWCVSQVSWLHLP